MLIAQYHVKFYFCATQKLCCQYYRHWGCIFFQMLILHKFALIYQMWLLSVKLENRYMFIYLLFVELFRCKRAWKNIILYEVITIRKSKGHLTSNLNYRGSRLIFSVPFSYISISSFTFHGAPYRIFFLFPPWLPCHFYLVATEQQQ